MICEVVVNVTVETRKGDVPITPKEALGNTEIVIVGWGQLTVRVSVSRTV